MIFAIIVQALFFGLIIAVIMSFLLAKTITTPVENLTKGAQLVASGNFDYKLAVNSSDEIGTLTNTFNKMAVVLKDTLNQIDSQKNTLENVVFIFG
jgi:two-component system sensor histidine kinase VicK